MNLTEIFKYRLTPPCILRACTVYVPCTFITLNYAPNAIHKKDKAPLFKHSGTVLFCLTDSADGAAGQTGRTVPECLNHLQFEGIYSFLLIYLEVSIYYRIFATERFRSQASPQQ